MKNIDIIYGKYLSEDKKVTVGGVQTYITDLCEIANELGIKTRVVQFAEHDFIWELPRGVQVMGVNVQARTTSCRYQQLYNKAVDTRSDPDTLTIFATDMIIPRCVSGRCIAIQHGISWDVPRSTRRPLPLQIAFRAGSAYRMAKRLNRMDAVVCVDYNFLNWYRTQLCQIPKSVFVIPNYSVVAPKCEKGKGKIKIIFARRLYQYRGTRIFTEAIRQLLDEISNDIDVTIAGTGEDEHWMHQQLDRYDNVHFITYESSESLEIHKDKHIAVVPTVGSEGTSLSLLEAMSAQCAVICTNVGGMTNIVIDGYNGLMVDSGNSQQLYDALKQTIEDSNMRKKIAQKGYETVVEGFNHDKWKKSWIRCLELFAEEKN